MANHNRIPGRTSERPDYWRPPTPDQIGRAAQFGLDLGAQDKYFSQAELAARDAAVAESHEVKR